MNDKHRPTLNPDQWAALGRFYQKLAEKLEVQWEVLVHHYDANYDGPGIQVTLHMPLEQHFQSLDPVVEGAFDVPGYHCSGFGHKPEPLNGCRVRDLDFHPVPK